MTEIRNKSGEVIRTVDRSTPGDVDLLGANLCDADLSGSDFRRADFSLARLRFADLCGADLRGAKFYRTDLCGTDFRDANLCGADFSSAGIESTDFQGADLADTCLDPASPASGAESPKWQHLKCRDGTTWVRAWRTRYSANARERVYSPGDLVEAPVFSTANTKCHPGLALYPTKKEAKKWNRFYGEGDHNHNDIFEVWTRPWEIQETGERARARWVIVG